MQITAPPSEPCYCPLCRCPLHNVTRHERGARWTDAQDALIALFKRRGATQKQIALTLGCAPDLISQRISQGRRKQR